MKLETKWLDWQPSAGKSEKSAGDELAKPAKPSSVGFGGAVSAENQKISAPTQEMPGFDPGAWTPEFEAWAPVQCVFRDRCFQSVVSLHLDFIVWCAGNGSVPCTRETFEFLLRDQGFTFADGMVYGLLLK
jgi:hypothetical protein